MPLAPNHHTASAPPRLRLVSSPRLPPQAHGIKPEAAPQPPAPKKGADAKKGPNAPDMLSLSASLVAVVKFMLYDLAGYLQVHAWAA